MRWEAGVPIHRAYGKQFDPLSFNRKQGLDFRFSSFNVDGCPIGVLYGADSLMGAISETLFHTVPAEGDRIKPRAIARANIEKYALSVLQPTRPLTLISMTGHGLGRSGIPVTQGELILSNAAQYAQTRAWAEAFYRHPVQADGFLLGFPTIQSCPEYCCYLRIGLARDAWHWRGKRPSLDAAPSLN